MPLIVSSISLPISSVDSDAVAEAIRISKTAFKDVDSAYIVKKSVDARKNNDIRFVYTVALELLCSEQEKALKINKENVKYREKTSFEINPTRKLEDRPVVVGFGPAGMFAGLVLAKYGYEPIIIERGADVETRVRDVEDFWKNAVLNTESNGQFGEGGAGTFSDGKLTTRISDEYCDYVLETFVKNGAPKEILYKAKPHIGTDNLRKIVKSIRQEIISLGGEVRFSTKLVDIEIKNSSVTKVVTNRGDIKTSNVILAIGHSARDTFEMLLNKDVFIEPKPFSVGVRAEHLQEDINKGLYGKHFDDDRLPKGEYQLSYRKDNRAVYTFCMCPGGFVVPSSSEENSVVTNGMSEYSRDGENANSAVVVSVDKTDFGSDPIEAINFQRRLERLAFKEGGENYCAPAQTLEGFFAKKKQLELARVKPTYSIGTSAADFNEIFPSKISDMLQIGFRVFDRRIKGFGAKDTVITGVETRTSSPVRITRNEEYKAIGIDGLYPCAEGAGYAGGIVSAAVDGIRVAKALIGG